MDFVNLKEKLIAAFKKHKYAVLILLLGVLLLVFPFHSTEENPSNQEVIIEERQNILDMEERLSSILSIVSGAGEVRVMLTLAKGEETVYQINGQYSTGEQSENTRNDTVTVTDADRNETGLVRQINPASYMGAVVVCEGADDPKVRLAIVEAVSNATGLGADRITVLKMK